MALYIDREQCHDTEALTEDIAKAFRECRGDWVALMLMKQRSCVFAKLSLYLSDKVGRPVFHRTMQVINNP